MRKCLQSWVRPYTTCCNWWVLVLVSGTQYVQSVLSLCRWRHQKFSISQIEFTSEKSTSFWFWMYKRKTSKLYCVFLYISFFPFVSYTIRNGNSGRRKITCWLRGFCCLSGMCCTSLLTPLKKRLEFICFSLFLYGTLYGKNSVDTWPWHQYVDLFPNCCHTVRNT